MGSRPLAGFKSSTGVSDVDNHETKPFLVEAVLYGIIQYKSCSDFSGKKMLKSDENLLSPYPAQGTLLNTAVKARKLLETSACPQGVNI